MSLFRPNTVDCPKFSLHNFSGRPVLVRATLEWEKRMSCADCGEPAKHTVFEIRPNHLGETQWYYCGECSIGG